jgi:uncharacterized membrane protein YdfJ with MMPL/SSD domain
VWWWILIWVLLVLIAAVYLASRAWGVWGQFKELTAEAKRASRTLESLQTQVDRLGDSSEPARMAVFESPRDLRRERHATRAALREQRRARQAVRRPTWARDVD